MTRRPLVSVGLAVYNGESFLAEAIDGLLAQTVDDLELIVSDNASSDRTEEIARAAARRDPRVRYHRNPVNLGLSANWNGLVRMASAGFFKWSSADDVCEPTYLERCLAVLEDEPDAVLAYACARFIDPQGAPLDIVDPGFDLRQDDPRERMRWVIGADHWVNATHGVFRIEALRRTHLLPDYPGGDYALLGELVLQGKIVEWHEPLFRRRIHPRASSQLPRGEEEFTAFISGRSGSVGFPGWRRLVGHWASILRCDLPARHKLELAVGVLRRGLRNRDHLLAELRANWRNWLARHFPRRSR